MQLSRLKQIDTAKDGLSLISVMVSIVIVGILAVMAKPSVDSIYARARMAEAKNNLLTARKLQQNRVLNLPGTVYESYDPIGYLGGGSHNCTNQAETFRVGDCKSLRYNYSANVNGRFFEIVAHAPSDKDNKYIMAGCTGAGSSIYNHNSGDVWAITNSGNPQHCRDILEFCPKQQASYTGGCDGINGSGRLAKGTPKAILPSPPSSPSPPSPPSNPSPTPTCSCSSACGNWSYSYGNWGTCSYKSSYSNYVRQRPYSGTRSCTGCSKCSTSTSGTTIQYCTPPSTPTPTSTPTPSPAPSPYCPPNVVPLAPPGRCDTECGCWYSNTTVNWSPSTSTFCSGRAFTQWRDVRSVRTCPVNSNCSSTSTDRQIREEYGTKSCPTSTLTPTPPCSCSTACGNWSYSYGNWGACSYTFYGHYIRQRSYSGTRSCTGCTKCSTSTSGTDAQYCTSQTPTPTP